jgi:hypothetical protein
MVLALLALGACVAAMIAVSVWDRPLQPSDE